MKSHHFERPIKSVAILLLILVWVLSYSTLSLHAQTTTKSKLEFRVKMDPVLGNSARTGRVFVIISTRENREPRFQVGRTGTPFWGVDVHDLKPGEWAIIDDQLIGSPVESISQIPAGEYYVQAVFNIYTKFERSDGHTVWMHQDQWEGQDWRRSPGNFYSDVIKLTIDPSKKSKVDLVLSNTIPALEEPKDTEYVKYIKIRSQLLSDFWGQDMYIGATILLPYGYETHPNVYYPTLHNHGHFSLRPPYGFGGGRQMDELWKGINFPRFIVIKFQHPCPYFDDSYAVNSPACGPYGDAIHEELIPLIEEQYRCIREGYARLLTGGSTGGWISFALQVLHPNFYGGTWSFAPDPLHFNNVEGINIYEDKNAYYKIHEWRTVPTPNTIDHNTGMISLTSKQRNYFELANGTKGRSGEQIDIWSAVFGPLGDDGYFKPLFDKVTGGIDPEVAAYWADHYDMKNYLERNWKDIGPDLVGKLHVFCGDRDNYQLNFGVYETEKFLESTRDPYYGGSFTYGARQGHGFNTMSSEQLLRVMAQQVLMNSAPGAKKDWMY